MAATLYSGIGGFSPNMFWIERETDVNSSPVSGFYISLVVPLPGHDNTALCTRLSSHFKLRKLTLCRGVIKVHRSGEFRFIPLDITVQPWKQFQPFISGLLLLQSFSKVYKHCDKRVFPALRRKKKCGTTGSKHQLSHLWNVFLWKRILFVVHSFPLESGRLIKELILFPVWGSLHSSKNLT